MNDRSAAIDMFLENAGWQGAIRSPLAGDASNRRYERIAGPQGKAVLMDAPSTKGEDVRPFVRITNLLRSQGLSAPEVMAADVENGFLLLEDLGDDLFARVVAADETTETPLYEAATDVLISLHSVEVPEDIAPYSPAFMAEMAALAWRWYLRGAEVADEDKANLFQNRFEQLLQQHAPLCDVLIQRDYHAENLLWLPDREGVARVGLLDYQDAMAGHRAYDLVSLLQDARRDVPQTTEHRIIAHYVEHSNVDMQEFLAAYHVLGAQRNLRILGVFARLCMHFGKAHYVDFIPRVWGYLLRDLAHPALEPIRDVVLQDLPAPSSDILNRLKEKCATIPTL